MSSISAGTTSTTTLVHSGDTTGSLVFKTNDTGSGGTTAVTIDTSQNVGIGTTSPTQKLEVATASGGTICLRYIGNSGNVTLGTDANNNMLFSIGNPPTEKMRINSSGLISMGTTGVANSQRLTLYGQTNQWGVGPTASTDTFSILNNGGTGVAITWGSTSWSAVSDINLKNITGEISSGVNKVCSLRAAEFTWKSDETAKPQVGLIAQDVQAVLPEAVSEENGTLSVRYTETIPLLVAAIKELKAINDQQAETINALTARVVALESK